MLLFQLLAAPNIIFKVLKKPIYFFEWISDGAGLQVAPFICLLTCKGHMYCICACAPRDLVLSGCARTCSRYFTAQRQVTQTNKQCSYTFCIPVYCRDEKNVTSKQTFARCSRRLLSCMWIHIQKLCTRACMCAHTSVCVCLWLCVYVCVCVCVRACKHEHGRGRSSWHSWWK